MYRQLLERFPEAGRVKIHSQKQGDIMVASVKVEIQGRVFQYRGRGPSKRSAVLAACKQAIILVLDNILIVLIFIALLLLLVCVSLASSESLPFSSLMKTGAQTRWVPQRLKYSGKERHTRRTICEYLTIVNYIKISKKHNDWFIY